MSGLKGSIPDGHGVRLCGEKYMHLRVLKGETYTARVKEADGSDGAQVPRANRQFCQPKMCVLHWHREKAKLTLNLSSQV